jgi:hypothetical protein
MELTQLKKPEHKKHRSPGNSKTPDALSLKPKRIVEPQAERRISKNNRTGLWPKTKSLPKWKAGKQKNSVAQGNDVRERG